MSNKWQGKEQKDRIYFLSLRLLLMIFIPPCISKKIFAQNRTIPDNMSPTVMAYPDLKLYLKFKLGFKLPLVMKLRE